eukprot:2382676-Rhodomonas_salina.2
MRQRLARTQHPSKSFCSLTTDSVEPQVQMRQRLAAAQHLRQLFRSLIPNSVPAQIDGQVSQPFALAEHFQLACPIPFLPRQHYHEMFGQATKVFNDAKVSEGFICLLHKDDTAAVDEQIPLELFADPPSHNNPLSRPQVSQHSWRQQEDSLALWHIINCHSTMRHRPRVQICAWFSRHAWNRSRPSCSTSTTTRSSSSKKRISGVLKWSPKC